MCQVFDLHLIRQARWARGAIEAIKQGQDAQFRAAALDGREVVVFGHIRSRRRYEPMLVAVDNELAAAPRGMRTALEPDQECAPESCLERPDRSPEPKSQSWYTVRLDHATVVFNHLDGGWPTQCRYATLGSDAVVVFGLRVGRCFRPAFVCVDSALKRRLSNVRELRLSQPDDGCVE
jgi:hypothetical protein